MVAAKGARDNLLLQKLQGQQKAKAAPKVSPKKAPTTAPKEAQREQEESEGEEGEEEEEEEEEDTQPEPSILKRTTRLSRVEKELRTIK